MDKSRKTLVKYSDGLFLDPRTGKVLYKSLNDSMLFVLKQSFQTMNG